LPTIEAGHDQVENEEVGLKAGDEFAPLLGVAAGVDLVVPGFFQIQPQERDEGGLVVDGEDAHGCITDDLVQPRGEFFGRVGSGAA